MSNLVFPSYRDAHIYFSAIDGSGRGEISNVSVIRLKISSQDNPIYNYNSRSYSNTSQGQVIATGVIGLNFLSFRLMHDMLAIVNNHNGDITKTTRAQAEGDTTTKYQSSTDKFAEQEDPNKPTFTQTGMFKNGRYHELVYPNPVYNGAIGGIMINIDPPGDNAVQSSLSITDVTFIDSEYAVDTHRSDGIVETYTFIGNLAR